MHMLIEARPIAFTFELDRISSPLQLAVGFLWQSSGFQNLVRRVKDLLCALFRNSITVVSNRRTQPILDIASAVVRALEVQSFAAEQCHGFGLNFAQTFGRPFRIREVCFCRMA